MADNDQNILAAPLLLSEGEENNNPSMGEYPNALIVKDVGLGGIAANHGIQKGDLLLKVEGVAASEIGIAKFQARIEGGKWEFLCQGQQEVTFETTQGCLGIDLELSPAAALHALRKVRKGKGCRFGMFRGPDPEDPFGPFWTLWENGCWKELQEKTPNYDEGGFVGRLLARQGCSSAPDALQRFRIAYRLQNDVGSPPHQLFNAAASYELGDQSATNFFLQYHKLAESGWTSDFHALVRYYTARDMTNTETAMHSATSTLLDSFESHPAYDAYLHYPESKRICALAAALCDVDTSGERSGRPEGANRFPDYELRIHCSSLKDQPASHLSLGRALERSNTILIVFMCDYRTNGPYSDLMKQWVRWHKAYSQSHGLKECHVITSSSKRTRLQWSEGESFAKEHQAPYFVLHDAGGSLESMVDEMLGGERGIAFAPYTILVRGHTVLLTAEDEEFMDASVLRALSKED